MLTLLFLVLMLCFLGAVAHQTPLDRYHTCGPAARPNRRKETRCR